MCVVFKWDHTLKFDYLLIVELHRVLILFFLIKSLGGGCLVLICAQPYTRFNLPL